MQKQIIIPSQKQPKIVWITIDPNITAQGYIVIGNLFKTIDSANLGSGIVSSKKGVKYPIFNPLILKDENHLHILNYANSFILQLVDEYLESNIFSDEILDQVYKLLNHVLSIGEYSNIPKAIIIEALSNFCLDYNMLSNGTFLRQPLNYILDILNIDGIHSKNYSISYIPTDYDFVKYLN